MGQINIDDLTSEIADVIKNANLQNKIWYRVDRFAKDVTIFDISLAVDICQVTYKNTSYLCKVLPMYHPVIESIQIIFDQYYAGLKVVEQYDNYDQALINKYLNQEN